MLNKIIKFMKYDYFLKKEILENLYYRLKTRLFYKRFFKEIGEGSIIKRPLKVNGSKNIILKERVKINNGTWILSEKLTEYEPKLSFDDNAIIGNFNHIICVNKILIGKNVLTADRVYITDNYHGYEDVNIPIMYQPIKSKGEVIIGDNTWIGDNASIISCKVGKHCVIGANSVVNKDIPDYSVAVGSPAKVVKRYNFKTEQWEKTNEMGEFLDVK